MPRSSAGGAQSPAGSGFALAAAGGIIEELSFTTVAPAGVVSFASRSKGRQAFRQGVEVTLPVSNQELASQIGTVRELVSRNLSRLQSEGMLKIDGRTVTYRI